MKILIILPPNIPSYFNAGHHLPIFQVGAYIRSLDSKMEVKCIDAAALNYTWKDIGDLLVQNDFDIICIMNDFDSIDNLSRFINYVKKLSNNSKLMTFGRLSNQIPEFFKKYDIDAISYSGDYETSVENFVKYVNGDNDISGLLLKKGDIWVKGSHGTYLDSSKWALPDVKEIPYDYYNKLYKNDQNKFCGIPYRTELVINVARGCPVGCQYCDVHIMQGRKERRLTTDVVVSYIEDSFEKYKFDYVSMYAPTFTLNKKWVLDFCEKLASKNRVYPWKCVTTLFHLDESLIKNMSESGCFRISIGLETLDKGSSESLPKIKQDVEKKFVEISEYCKKYNVELNCFVILGLPGETLEGIKYTIQKVKSTNSRFRPTIYTPYQLLRADMSVEEISSFNRQLFSVENTNILYETEIYELFYKKDNNTTKVFEKIPKNN